MSLNIKNNTKVLSALSALLLCITPLCVAPALAEAASTETQTQVQFSAITTARSSGALEATMVEGGSWFSVSQPVHQAIYIKHPKGDLLFDTGVGNNTPAALEKLGWFDRQLFSIGEVFSVADQLTQQNMPIENISAIIPSHLHWDHTGGLPELLGIPVWSEQAGIDFALQGDAPAFLKEHLVKEINWQPLTLTNQEYMGFERSLDIYNDNSLVLVSLAGHTPGQVGLFLTTDAKQTYFFIGDTTWLMKGVTENKPRPGITQWLVGVDADVEKNSAMIRKINNIRKLHPGIKIVPAHDQFVSRELPQFPYFSKLFSQPLPLVSSQ
ncbi:MBL fold metallo-hydrolase [Litoribacillus peritrichatus]|uniref:MBL fold metallo-hydrolase n=1 Tax=Litoribacillus peritrichatus TaxID=718191 RepID=A0ABP7M7Y1_9GAMM